MAPKTAKKSKKKPKTVLTEGQKISFRDAVSLARKRLALPPEEEDESPQNKIETKVLPKAQFSIDFTGILVEIKKEEAKPTRSSTKKAAAKDVKPASSSGRKQIAAKDSRTTSSYAKKAATKKPKPAKTGTAAKKVVKPVKKANRKKSPGKKTTKKK